MKKPTGDALKGLACRQMSFSEEKRTMIHTFCVELKLPAEVEEQVVDIYKTFLRKTLDITITPKSAICASIYIAAINCGEQRTQLQFKRLFGISEPTIRWWSRFVTEVVGKDVLDEMLKSNLRESVYGKEGFEKESV